MNATTPIRLVHLTLLGAALVLAEFTLFPLILLLNNHPLEIVLGLTLFAVAVSLTFVNRYRLSRGIKRNLWTEAQLETARQFMNQRSLSWLQAALILGTFFLAAVRLISHSRFAGLFAFLLVPNNTITDLKRLLSPKPAPRCGTFAPVDWANFHPIHSTHWGEPPSTI